METLVTTLGTLFTAISIPIMFLNYAGGIVAAIWLIIIGKWWLVVLAVAIAVSATFVISILMIPILLLAAPIAWTAGRKKNVFIFLLGFLMAALSSLFTYTLMLIYGVGSFIFVSNNYEGGMILPYLFLAYAVSTGPWTYMAGAEIRSGNDGLGTIIPGSAVCISSIAMMGVVIFYGSPTIMELSIACAIPLVFAWILQMIIIFSTLKKNP